MKNIFLWRNRSLIKNHSLLDNPLILPQIQILISFWSQKAEKQKFNIEENVMLEPVKMPFRHFLRRDYLHIFFYIKFLLFVSLVQQISILIFHKWQEKKGLSKILPIEMPNIINCCKFYIIISRNS